MSKTTIGFLLLGVSILLGFGSCGLYAATYGEAGPRVVAAAAMGFLLSLSLFFLGAYLIALGTLKK